MELIPSTGLLDELIFSGADVWSIPLEEQNRLREKFVKEAFAYHLEHCADYRNFASKKLGSGWSGNTIDIAQIPLIPTTAFKARNLISTDEAGVSKWSLSSGTQGLRSKIGRDRTSLERLLGSVRAGASLIHDLYDHEVEILNLGPETQEAGDIWFSYVMSLLELVYPTRFYVSNQEFLIDAAISDLMSLLETDLHVTICGAPFLVLDLLSHIERQGIKMNWGHRLTIVTAGGWKRRQNEALDRHSLVGRAVAALGIADASQFRDVFNQVELNTVLFECSAGKKHVPPWVAAYARSPQNLLALPSGEEGLLSFLDASATGYPCFIVGDDIGTVDHGKCACGLNGTTLSINRRVKRRDMRGCSTSININDQRKQ